MTLIKLIAADSTRTLLVRVGECSQAELTPFFSKKKIKDDFNRIILLIFQSIPI